VDFIGGTPPNHSKRTNRNSTDDLAARGRSAWRSDARRSDYFLAAEDEPWTVVAGPFRYLRWLQGEIEVREG
jgi:hypothetical protein